MNNPYHSNQRVLKCNDCSCLMAEGPSDSSLLPGSNNPLNPPVKQIPSSLYLEYFILQDTAACWEFCMGLREVSVDVTVQGPESEPIRNLPACLMLPCTISELNSLLTSPCAILDKISRTSWLSLWHLLHPELLKLSLVCYLGILWFSITGPEVEKTWRII